MTGFGLFADRFGRAAVWLALAGLVVAVGLAVLRHDDGDRPAAASYRSLAPADPVRIKLDPTASGARSGAAPVLAVGESPERTLLGSPVDAALVTWWSGSARPGSGTGQTVLTAHTRDSRGGLSAIGDLDPGDLVDVLTRTGTLRYRIDRVRSYTEQSYPGVAAGLYRQDTGSGRLVLVSAQQWDGVDYQQLVVAVATPLGEPD